ncbi:hypothetical protein BJX76DRAFT_359010 [Aspergillus varians]
MARGNQREVSRQKQEKKDREKKSANNLSGSDLARKKEDDAAKMRAKQANAEAKKATDGGKKK